MKSLITDDHGVVATEFTGHSGTTSWSSMMWEKMIFSDEITFCLFRKTDPKNTDPSRRRRNSLFQDHSMIEKALDQLIFIQLL